MPYTSERITEELSLITKTIIKERTVTDQETVAVTRTQRRVHAVADAIKMEKSRGSKMISNWKVKEMGRSRVGN